jgi:Zn-dependent protease
MLERITRIERRDLFIAWIAIALAFTLIFIKPGPFWTFSGDITIESVIFFLAVSLLTVGVGFVLHELAHKFMAIKFGHWAEFRKDNQMLLIAVVLAALVGVVFAAPGATIIVGPYLSREENGKISAAGPATNLVLCVIFFLITEAALTFGLISLAIFGYIGFSVNAMIAAFNMLPVSVLDGKKILAWSPAVFAVMIVLSFGALVASSFILEWVNMLIYTASGLF